MIAELRRRHSRLWLALAFALPALFAAAMAARRAPVQGPLPPDRGALAPADEREVGELASLAAPLAARVTITHAGTPDRLTLRVEPRGNVGDPDLLAYWSASEPVGEGVPATAVLLGAVGARRPLRLALPPDAVGGWIVVYSLAHAERVAAAALPALPPRR